MSASVAKQRATSPTRRLREAATHHAGLLAFGYIDSGTVGRLGVGVHLACSAERPVILAGRKRPAAAGAGAGAGFCAGIERPRGVDGSGSRLIDAATNVRAQARCSRGKLADGNERRKQYD